MSMRMNEFLIKELSDIDSARAAIYIWGKVFKNVPNKICGRQPLKNLMGYGLFNQIAFNSYFFHVIWDKVFKSGPSKICGRQPLKNLMGYDLFNQIAFNSYFFHGIWDKVFKSRPSKICGRQLLKKFEGKFFTCSTLEYFVLYIPFISKNF